MPQRTNILEPIPLGRDEGQRDAPTRGSGISQPNSESPQGWYLVRGPCLLVGPVPVAPHVPPLDLQGVGGRAAAAEGAGHLHVLACPRRHVVGRLCEQGCANKQEGVGRNSQGSGNGRASRGGAGGSGEADRAGVARPAGGNGLVSGGAPGEALPGWAEGHVAAAGKTQEGRSRPKALNAPFRLGPDPGACRRCGRLCRGVRDQRRAGLQNVSEEARRPERKLSFLLILPDFSNCFHPDSLPGYSQPLCTVISAFFAKPNETWPPQLRTFPCLPTAPRRKATRLGAGIRSHSPCCPVNMPPSTSLLV